MAKSDGFKWYPRQPTKMIRGVAGMGAALIGCYNVILDLIYEDEGSCPNDAAFVGGILGESPRQSRALINKLLEMGKIEAGEDGRLRNKKAQEVIELQASRARAASESGRKGGRSRHAKVSPTSDNSRLGQATLKHLEENRIDKTRKKKEVAEQKPSASAPKRRSDIPKDFPSEEAKEAAKKYWNSHMRPDLVTSVEDQAAQFRDHHVSHGKIMADWPAAWRTWIRNAISFSKPRGIVQPASAPDDVHAWVTRLDWFHFGRPKDNFDDGVPVGHWEAHKWGPKPGADGCRVPDDAIKEFVHRHPARAVK